MKLSMAHLKLNHPLSDIFWVGFPTVKILEPWFHTCLLSIFPYSLSDACLQVLGPQCRYAVGSILSEGESKADEELLKRYQTFGFNVFSFPEVTHVVTTSFQHRAFFSALLGVRRVYSRLEHYIKVQLPLYSFYQSKSIEFCVAAYNTTHIFLTK